MKPGFMRQVEDLENVICVCFGTPSDTDLPQISDEHGVVIDLMQEMSGKPLYEIDAEFYHHTETYQ
jgi:hypothetical protein